jgi:hypothetical protein
LKAGRWRGAAPGGERETMWRRRHSVAGRWLRRGGWDTSRQAAAKRGASQSQEAGGEGGVLGGVRGDNLSGRLEGGVPPPPGCGKGGWQKLRSCCKGGGLWRMHIEAQRDAG